MREPEYGMEDLALSWNRTSPSRRQTRPQPWPPQYGVRTDSVRSGDRSGHTPPVGGRRSRGTAETWSLRSSSGHGRSVRPGWMGPPSLLFAWAAEIRERASGLYLLGYREDGPDSSKGCIQRPPGREYLGIGRGRHRQVAGRAGPI